MRKEPTAEQINKHIDNFTPIYGEGGKEMPEGVKLTVWCSNDKESQGFACNVTTDEMGLEQLIARSWILESELKQLLTP